MKKEQPEMKKATITCACGNVIETLSIKDAMKVDVCSSCHPFWTGAGTQVSRGGRADKFRKKYGM